MKTNDANAMYQHFLTKMGSAYDPSKIKGIQVIAWIIEIIKLTHTLN